MICNDPFSCVLVIAGAVIFLWVVTLWRYWQGREK